MDNTNYCEYLENVSKLLSEKKISEELAKEMLKSFNGLIQSIKEIEINHDNNVKEIEIARSNNQKEMLQIRCTDNGMKVTSMERAIKIADAVVVSCSCFCVCLRCSFRCVRRLTIARDIFVRYL